MHELLHADCSIRKSADQSLLTAPRSLSQLTTSFFGSQCQGIHSALFFALPFVLYGSSQNFRFLTRCSFLPDILVFTFMSFLLTRSFTLHFCFFMFCFQAAFFCPFPRTDINRQLLFLSTDICSCSKTSAFQSFSRFFEISGGHKWTRTIDLTLIRRAL